MPVPSSSFLRPSYDGIAVRVNFLKEKSSIMPLALLRCLQSLPLRASPLPSEVVFGL